MLKLWTHGVSKQMLDIALVSLKNLKYLLTQLVKQLYPNKKNKLI